MAALILKPGREKSVLRRHPWIFSGAIAQVKGDVKPGETVEVYSADHQWLAYGAYSHNSQIRTRIFSWDQTETINETLIYNRILKAHCSRQSLYDLRDSNAYRLVHGESDGLPGLIADRYGDVIVVQFLSTGVEYWKGVILRSLVEISGTEMIYERSDADVRTLEGLPPKIGEVGNRHIPETIIIREHGINYKVNIKSGHKTGFYLDQRTNHLIARSLAEAKDILDCFSYTGGFSLNCYQGKANSILAIDQSAEALELIQVNCQLNEFDTDAIQLEQGDVFQILRRMRDSAKTYDLIILDPPKFAPTTSQVQRAARGYKDINLLAMKLLRENGILITFSCSGGISQELFVKIIAGAALDSGLEFQTIGQLHQAADHPVATNFPEGAYLKGLILRRT